MKAAPGLLTLALWWGYCLTPSTAQDTPSTAPAPSLSPASSAAPTPVLCPDEAAAADQCFGNSTAKEYCERCIVQYWPQNVTTCVELVDGTCFGFANCDCGTCEEDVRTYIECLSDCDVACEVGPTADPASSPAPTLPNACPDEYAAFNNCVDPINGGRGCEGCVIAFWPDPPYDSCTQIDDETCTGLASCQCNDCDAELITYLSCLTQGCSFNCTGATPTDDSCPSEQAAIVSCIEDSGFNPSECAACLAGFTNDTDTCSRLQEGVCAGLEQCNCGDCESEILAGLDCTNPICNLNKCDGTPPDEPTPAAPSPPGLSPAPAGGGAGGGARSPTAPVPAPAPTSGVAALPAATAGLALAVAAAGVLLLLA